MSANDRQVAGDHYRRKGAALQHWDLVVMYEWDYLTAQVIKYMMRWRDKNGMEDLRKAAHYLEKLIEVEEGGKSKESDSVVETDRPQVKQTGYIGFTYEGGWANGDLYTCTACRTEVKVPVHASPHEFHSVVACQERVGRAYVAQD